MERNWDTIREILIKFEELDPEKGLLQLEDFPADRAYKYSYHVELLLEAGLIHGEMSKTLGRHAQSFWANQLTWEGHEFLDAIRSDTVWNKTKSSFVKGGLSMTLDLIKGVATDVAAAYLKSTIGS
ncbi:MAG TPA: DUF2513 domain-containing protein [Smithellaceae bacterium]|nr:DUF2513 domain-containing protein [Smithellaceae bacterium]